MFRALWQFTAWLVAGYLLGGSPAAAESAARVDASDALLKLVQTATLKHSGLADALAFPARIELDQSRMSRIGSSVTGRITEIHALLGQTVKKGEALALLNSSELGQAQSDYLKAVSQVALQRIAVHRSERLFSSGTLPEAVLQERQEVLVEAEVDLRTAADRLRVMGMSSADIQRLDKQQTIYSFSVVPASMDGVVIATHIVLGQVVQPADDLYTIADLSRLWVVAEVPETQVRWTIEGDSAEAEVPALPGVLFNGKLIYVADMVNPETRTITVRMAVDNRERLLKPQMLATLKIKQNQQQGYFISDQAVVRDGGKEYVYVQTQPRQFELREVRLGRDIAGMRELLHGLGPDEAYVTSGAFHINAERLRHTIE